MIKEISSLLYTSISLKLEAVIIGINEKNQRSFVYRPEIAIFTSYSGFKSSPNFEETYISLACDEGGKITFNKR